MGKSKCQPVSYMGKLPPCKTPKCPIYPGERGLKGATGPFGGGDGDLPSLVDVIATIPNLAEGVLLTWNNNADGYGSWTCLGAKYAIGIKTKEIDAAGDYFAGGIALGYNEPKPWVSANVVIGEEADVAGAGAGFGMALGYKAVATPTANSSFAIGGEVSAAEGVAVPEIKSVTLVGLPKTNAVYKTPAGVHNVLFQDATGLLVEIPVTFS